MRIELEDEKKKVSPEDNVLNPETKYKSDLTRKERRLQEKEKLKDMGFVAKLQYIWMYYKPVMAGIVAVIVLFFIGRDMYENSKMQTLLNISVVNAGDFDTDGYGDAVKEFLGSEDEYEEVAVTTTFRTNQNGDELDYYTQMAYIAQLQAKSLDVVVLPKPLYENFAKQEMFADLKEVLDEETYEAFGDQIKGDHIELSGSELSKDMILYYDPICVAVVLNSPNMENAGKWIATLAE